MNIAPRGMIPFTALACIAIAVVAGPRPCAAQTPVPATAPDAGASHSSAQSEAGEPRATTSPDAPAETERSTSPSSSDASRAEHRPQAKPTAVNTDAKAARADGKSAGSGKNSADKLELQTATVTGDREQPKVMYIVPWKRSDIGDLSGKPMNSLLDEALAPVDRDEFRREVMYYQAVRADASQNGAAGTPASPR